MESMMDGKASLGVRISATALLCLAVVAAGCGAGRTSSAPPDQKGERVAKAEPTAGPVLHGDAVAWGEGGIGGRDEGASIKVLVGSPNSPARLLHEQPLSKGQPEWWFGDFAASPDGIALVRAWIDCEPPPYDQCVDGTDVAVGASNEAFRLLPRHVKGCEYVPASHHVDVDGSRIVFSEAFCRPGCGSCPRIAIDDVTDSKPPRVVVPRPKAVDDVRIAGNFIAARSVSWEWVAVFDLRSGKQVYEVRSPAYAAIDLQADGKLVAVWRRRPEGTTAAWFSPAEPWKHTIPISPVLVHPYETHVTRIAVRLANDHVAFERQVTPEKSELVVADLNGKVVQRVADFDKKRARVADFDFDGKRLTWATQEVVKVTKECHRISEAGHMACFERYAGPKTIYLARLG